MMSQEKATQVTTPTQRARNLEVARTTRLFLPTLTCKYGINLISLQLILAEPALIFDSVYAFAKGLERAVIDGPDLKMS